MGILLAIFGAAAAAAAGLSDIFGLDSSPGFGRRQQQLLFAGIVILSSGLVVASSRGRHLLGRALAEPRLRTGKLLILSICSGLFTGLAEIAILGVEKLWFARILHVSRHAVWMCPLAYAVIFLVLALGLLLAARRWPGFASLQGASFVFSFVAAFSLLLLSSSMHIYASTVLSLGLGFQAARLASKIGTSIHKPARYLAACMILLVLLSAAAVQGWEAWTERSSLARLPPHSPGSPNVLLIVLDTVRSQSMSVHGYSRPTTPFLERLAKKSAFFERAYAPSPWTLPSHGTMFTGRYPHELEAGWETPLDEEHPTLAEALAQRGYATAGFVGNLLYCSREHGLNRGFLHYEDYPVSPHTIATSSGLARLLILWALRDDLTEVRNPADQITAWFLRWLDQEQERPFFAFLNYYDAHFRYLPPAPYDTKFGPKSEAVYKGHWRRWSPGELRGLVDAYDGCIGYVDHWLERLMDELDRRNLLEDTLVVITSDHGEQFGEHGLVDHGNSLYTQLLHVPLILSFPSRIPGGIRVADAVTLRDLPATVMDLLGAGSGSPFPGGSLARFWEENGHSDPGDTSLVLGSLRQGVRVPDWFPSSRGDMYSLTAGGARLIVNGDGSEELYEVDSDPDEEKNLIESRSHRELASRMREALKRAFGPAR